MFPEHVGHQLDLRLLGVLPQLDLPGRLAGAVDDPDVEDQDEGDHGDHRRQLPARPRELVVAHDDTLHRLQVSSPGYGAYTGTVRFDANKHLSIQLRRSRPRKNSVKPEPPEAPEPPDRIYTESPYAPVYAG